MNFAGIKFKLQNNEVRHNLILQDVTNNQSTMKRQGFFYSHINYWQDCCLHAMSTFFFHMLLRSMTSMINYSVTVYYCLLNVRIDGSLAEDLNENAYLAVFPWVTHKLTSHLTQVKGQVPLDMILTLNMLLSVCLILINYNSRQCFIFFKIIINSEFLFLLTKLWPNTKSASLLKGLGL